ncbi:MAG TPA: ribonuclease domain-containing protein [Gallionella sp.]|nr:ribonuclease domain-containing protein [Gallionella sp.]
MARSLRLWWILAAALLWLSPGQAESVAQSGLPIVAVAELPTEARDTLHVIKQGGPFAYPRDGAVFKNYERILPKQPRGYYREYTVKMSGAHNRGVRRIVCGPLPECYYSPDHYRTFKRIRE